MDAQSVTTVDGDVLVRLLGLPAALQLEILQHDDLQRLVASIQSSCNVAITQQRLDRYVVEVVQNALNEVC